MDIVWGRKLLVSSFQKTLPACHYLSFHPCDAMKITWGPRAAANSWKQFAILRISTGSLDRVRAIKLSWWRCLPAKDNSGEGCQWWESWKFDKTIFKIHLQNNHNCHFNTIQLCLYKNHDYHIYQILLAPQSGAHTIAPHRDPIQSQTHPIHL